MAKRGKRATQRVHGARETGTKHQGEVERSFAMLENAPINVLFADEDLVIQYVNPASNETLKTLQQYLPIPVDQIVGSSIDIFHKNPAHQRKILSDPKNLPHRANIEIGPEVADLLVSPIYDQDGDYLGPMVTWEVVTKKLKLEREMSRINNMMENAPVNVLFADKDLTIQYVNPASAETLKTLQQYLPIPVDQIVGSSID
ncbi:MAG: PAS domain-containing protein, partial [Planctomycetota bacterium]